MIRTLTILARLRLTIGLNSSVDSWRKVPVIRALPLGRLIGNDNFSIVYYTLAGFLTLLKTLLLNLLYVGVLVFLPGIIYLEAAPIENLLPEGGFFGPATHAGFFLGIFLMLGMIGSVFRHTLLKANSDTVYAIYLMRMDAREYALSDMALSMLKLYLGQAPALLLFGLLSDLPLGICLLLPFVTLGFKQIGSARRLYYISSMKKSGTDGKETGTAKVLHNVLNVILIFCGLLLIVLQFVTCTSMQEKLYLPLIFAVLIAGGLCLIPVLSYRDYFCLYEKLRQHGDFQEKETTDLKKTSTQEALELDTEDLTAAHSSSAAESFGYDEFHKVFMRRHKKLMTRSANRMTFVILVIFLIITALRIITLIIGEEGAGEIFKSVASESMPYMTLLLYWLNRGENMTNAMFINCDHAMLAYSFYREPATILAMFRRRLRSLVLVNLRPAAAIALCITACGFYGAEKLTFIPLLYGLTVLLLSVFFSLHTLVMYYLLQPFDLNSQSTGKMYRIVSVITYIACYSIDDIVKDPIVYCIGAAVFTIVYIVLGLLLVQCFAPKTFRIR